MEAYLFATGAVQAAIGPGACGFVLADTEGDRLAFGGWHYAATSADISAYMGLIWGLRNALALGVTDLTAFIDSRSVADAVNGAAKPAVEYAALRNLACDLGKMFDSCTVARIDRSENKQAVDYSNEAFAAQTHIGVFEVDPNGNRELALPDDALEDGFDGFDAARGTVGDLVLDEDYLSRNGTYVLTVKSRFNLAADQYESPRRWSVQAVVSSTHAIDPDGHIYAVTDLADDLERTIAAFNGRQLDRIPPFDRIPPTIEHLARIVYWDLDARLPRHVELDEVSIWSNDLGAKIGYRGRS